MTDTIIQNSNINEIIDITKYQFTAKPETDGSFSALFTNASNKAEQTQSNFIDTAVKSNTSSINKYALDSKNTQTDSKNQDNTKNISKKTQSATTEGNTVSKNVENNQNVKPKKNQTASNFNDNKTVEQNKKADNTAFNSQKPVSTTKEGISVNKADTRSQNIDNNSLESSPVSLDNAASNNSDVQKIQSETIILNDEITAKNDIQQEIKEIVENILITYDIPINTNNDNSINTDAISDKLNSDGENYDFVIQTIDEISSQIDDMNLSQDDKDKITEAFNKLKTALQNIEENFEEDKTNNDIVDRAKTLVNNSLEVAEKNKEPDSQTTEIKNEKVENYEKTNTEIAEKSNVSDNDEIKKIQNKTNKDTVESDNVSQNEKITTDKKETTKNYEDLNKNIEKSNIQEIDTNKNSEKIRTVSNNFENTKPEKNTDIKIENTTNKDTENKINSDDLKIKDDDSISDIVSKLKEFEKSEEYSKLSKDEKIEVQEIINKLDSAESKDDIEAISKENKQIIEDVKKEIETIINTDTKEANDNIKIAQEKQPDIQNNEIAKSDNSNFKQQDNSKNNNNANDTLKMSSQKVDKTEYTKANTVNIDNDNTPDTDIDINIDVDSDFETEEKTNAQNKFSLIDEIKEDFVESVEYSEETPVVISVADEVVKFALSENNSLPNQMAVGNITYDPANKAVMIRNAQNIAQNFHLEETDGGENNILNQIGDKLYQLKDSQKLNLILRPNDLGRLSIELISDKNGLTTNIIAQNESVRSYIEKNINNLRTQLSEAGVNVNTIQIKTAGQDSATTYNGNQNRETFEEDNSQKQNQQFKQNQNQRQKENLAHLRNYDMHFEKDFSGILDKTLSYIN